MIETQKGKQGGGG